MNDLQNHQNGGEPERELTSARWSVVSFDKCEASGLTYADAAKLMAELNEKRVAGLCIVTDDAAARLTA